MMGLASSSPLMVLHCELDAEAEGGPDALAAEENNSGLKLDMDQPGGKVIPGEPNPKATWTGTPVLVSPGG